MQFGQYLIKHTTSNEHFNYLVKQTDDSGE